jgi:hypothetical protein
VRMEVGAGAGAGLEDAISRASAWPRWARPSSACARTSHLPKIRKEPSISEHKPLTRQKAFVTGQLRHWQGVAISFGEAGADAAVNYVEGEDSASVVAAELRRAGGKSVALKADISAKDQVEELFERAVSRVRHDRHSRQQRGQRRAEQQLVRLSMCFNERSESGRCC